MGNDEEGGAIGLHQSLNTPWDVCLVSSQAAPLNDPDCLLIALSGCHQIWLLALRDGVQWYKRQQYVYSQFPIFHIEHILRRIFSSNYCINKKLNANLRWDYSITLRLLLNPTKMKTITSSFFWSVHVWTTEVRNWYRIKWLEIDFRMYVCKSTFWQGFSGGFVPVIVRQWTGRAP